MTPDQAVLFSTIILPVPMGYILLRHVIHSW